MSRAASAGEGAPASAAGTGAAAIPDAGTDAGGAPSEPPAFAHTMAPITIQAGEEITGVCQSWTLGNDAPINVHRVMETNQGAFHHSNWIWVTDDSYPGDDGTWKCADRGFDQILAGAVGGVFFAQSTQARADTQAFPDGVAFQIPAHARVIGDVHLLNAGVAALTTELHFDLFALEADAVKVQLQPMAFTNLALEIPPAVTTRARMECATPQPDFDIYYILPHFHVLGRTLSIGVSGGAQDGSEIFRSSGMIGDSVGRAFDPPIAVKGASGLAITCEYQNPTGKSVQYGEGDQEMCVTLIYSSGAKAGGETLGNVATSDSGGVHTTDGLCVSVGAP